MFSPCLYTVRKFDAVNIVNANYKLTINEDQNELYKINQQDNMLFRQIRLITKSNTNYNKYIVFVDCMKTKRNKEIMTKLISNGFTINDTNFILTEKSASMSRNSMIGFVDSSIEKKLKGTVTMGLSLKKTVISKYLAYRGLMLSSCFCIENWLPKIIVVDDYTKIIANQHIRYAVDSINEYIDEETDEIKKYINKEITDGVHDIPIDPFDGCGLHHPDITREVAKRLNIVDENPTSIMWRLPYVKGVTHDFNYVDFFKERNIIQIKDVWGNTHSVEENSEPMIILTKSMYKGYKYFYKDGTIDDWKYYWEMFKKYNHCIGVAKWNYSAAKEPQYTRTSYQILQDIDIDYDDFVGLSDYSLDWVSKIIDGDTLYTNCFLGLTGEKQNPSNDYMRAILKNPNMLKDPCVRKYLINMIKKYIDEFKCGKLYMNATFRILTPDLVMLAEYIGGLTPVGTLKEDEFYCKTINGTCKNEYLIERDSHICASEHVILNGVNNNTLNKYCSHLDGICMVNAYSIVLQRLNGADTDGDLVLVLNEPILKNHIDRTRLPVMDMEDKITVPEKDIAIENIIESIILSMDSRIGEYSNVASGYHNKKPKSSEQKQKYLDFIDLISILNAKEIDFAKTGVRFNLPPFIGKYAKPLPYFMKYAGEYYKRQPLSKSKSNLNRLCFDIEKWHKKIRFKRTYKDFDYKIMIDEDLQWDNDKFERIEEIYLDFKKTIGKIKKNEAIAKNKFHANHENIYGDLSYFQIINTRPNYKSYYNDYRKKCKEICPDSCELANYVVELCYGKYSKYEKNFAWLMVEEGIVDNIKQVKHYLPSLDTNGDLEYLGKKYKMIEYVGGDI